MNEGGRYRSRFGLDLYRRVHAWLLSRRNSAYEETIADRKRALFRDIGGTIVEIGPGGGPNLAYYPRAVSLIGIEPNPHFEQYFARVAAERGIDAELRTGTADRIDLPSGSADAVVSTLVLCCVHDVDSVLKEVLRVLKPGGRFYFIEHVAAPAGTGTAHAQRLLQPLWTLVADGCHPDRPTWRNIEEAGFREVRYEHFRVPAPVVGPHIAGIATKESESITHGDTRQTAPPKR